MPSNAEPNLGVLVSGTGTILAAMIEAGLAPRCVLADRDCRAVERARQLGLEAAVVARSSYRSDFDRRAYSIQLADELGARGVDVVAMAGFGTVLSPEFFNRYEARVLNTHPALLPAFPGWHAVDDALAYGVKVTGCTVHIATPAVDAGPILAQQAVEVTADDTVESLHERIKAVERSLYPATIKAFLAATEKLDNDQPVNGKPGNERPGNDQPVSHQPVRQNRVKGATT